MRAALLSAPRTVEIIDHSDPPRPEAGQLVIRVEATSICGSDLSAYRGVHPWIKPPTIPGHECVGTVHAAGDGVAEDLVGARVCVEPNMCCGSCRFCRAGLPNICPNYTVLGESHDLPGGLAEYLTVPARQVYTLPSSISADEGALVQPLAISYEGAVNRAQLRAGERVVVVGAGPIGLGALLVSRLKGAQVMAVDLVDYRLAMAERLGADRTLRADDPQLESNVLEWTGGYGVDVAIEAVGGAQGETIRTAQRLTAPRGRIVVLGSFKDTLIEFPVGDLKKREQSLVGSHGHPETFTPVIELMANGSLQAGELISHRLPLDSLPDAFRMLDERADGVMKVVIRQS